MASIVAPASGHESTWDAFSFGAPHSGQASVSKWRRLKSWEQTLEQPDTNFHRHVRIPRGRSCTAR